MASQKCICDPGLPGADSILASKRPPVSTTDEGIPQAQLHTEEEEKEPTGALSRPTVGEIAPEAETTGGEGTQPQTQDEGAAESGV